MPVLMVGVGIMDMPMPQAHMRVPVTVRFTGRIAYSMAMAVMFVVDVFVRMSHWLVFMLMFMSLGQV